MMTAVYANGREVVKGDQVCWVGPDYEPVDDPDAVNPDPTGLLIGRIVKFNPFGDVEVLTPLMVYQTHASRLLVLGDS